jgi:hypothetical protein
LNFFATSEARRSGEEKIRKRIREEKAIIRFRFETNRNEYGGSRKLLQASREGFVFKIKSKRNKSVP